jgi:hypothetical protein
MSAEDIVDANDDAERDPEGIEEAEMYARFAGEIVQELFEDPSEAHIAAVGALIQKSRTIMQRLIQEHLNRPKA